MTHLLAGNGKDFAILDVEGEELISYHITLDVDLIIIGGMSNILDGLVVVASPKEGHVAEGHHLSEHVEGGVGTLVHGSHVVLNSHSLSSRPVGVGSTVTSGENILGGGLKEGVAKDAAPLV